MCWFIALVYKVSVESKERDNELRKEVRTCAVRLDNLLTVDSREESRKELNIFLDNTNKDIYKEFDVLKNRADGLDSIVDGLRKEVSESGKMIEVTVKMNEVIVRELRTAKPVRPTKPAKKTITKIHNGE